MRSEESSGRTDYQALKQEIKDNIQRSASMLLSDNAENFEYDRGICELAAELLGLPLEQADALQSRLRAIRMEILGI